MIKSCKSLAQLDELAQKHYDILIEKPFSINKNLQKRIINSDSEEKEFYESISNNFKEIITGRPKNIHGLIKIIKPKYEKFINKRIGSITDTKEVEKIKTKVKNEVLGIFNYKKFCETQKVNDEDINFAYKLAIDHGISVCPYCNRQFVFTFNSDEGKTRPQFDHFYDKATHPYFALSFYNLIPSCSLCNSVFKHTVEFDIENNIHPLIEGCERMFTFTYKPQNVNFLVNDPDSIEIDIKEIAGVDKSDIQRARNNLDKLKILKLYSMHSDYVSEIIAKAIHYSESKVEELLKIETGNGKKLFKSKGEVYRFIFSNYIDEADFGKRILSKLTKDIALECGYEEKLL